MFNRQTPAYRQWRKQVIDRDNGRCTVCGSMEMLEAHHIKPVAEYPELALNVDNGTTLCRKCHYDIHGKSYSAEILNYMDFVGSMSPLMKKLKDIGNELSYRMLIFRRIWRNIPIPRQARRWLEKFYAELFIGLTVILLANLGNLFQCLIKMIH